MQEGYAQVYTPQFVERLISRREARFRRKQRKDQERGFQWRKRQEIPSICLGVWALKPLTRLQKSIVTWLRKERLHKYYPLFSHLEYNTIVGIRANNIWFILAHLGANEMIGKGAKRRIIKSTKWLRARPAALDFISEQTPFVTVIHILTAVLETPLFDNEQPLGQALIDKLCQKIHFVVETHGWAILVLPDFGKILRVFSRKFYIPEYEQEFAKILFLNVENQRNLTEPRLEYSSDPVDPSKSASMMPMSPNSKTGQPLHYVAQHATPYNPRPQSPHLHPLSSVPVQSETFENGPNRIMQNRNPHHNILNTNAPSPNRLNEIFPSLSLNGPTSASTSSQPIQMGLFDNRIQPVRQGTNQSNNQGTMLVNWNSGQAMPNPLTGNSWLLSPQVNLGEPARTLSNYQQRFPSPLILNNILNQNSLNAESSQGPNGNFSDLLSNSPFAHRYDEDLALKPHQEFDVPPPRLLQAHTSQTHHPAAQHQMPIPPPPGFPPLCKPDHVQPLNSSAFVNNQMSLPCNNVMSLYTVQKRQPALNDLFPVMDPPDLPVHVKIRRAAENLFWSIKDNSNKRSSLSNTPGYVSPPRVHDKSEPYVPFQADDDEIPFYVTSSVKIADDGDNELLPKSSTWQPPPSNELWKLPPVPELKASNLLDVREKGWFEPARENVLYPPVEDGAWPETPEDKKRAFQKIKDSYTRADALDDLDLNKTWGGENTFFPDLNILKNPPAPK